MDINLLSDTECGESKFVTALINDKFIWMLYLTHNIKDRFDRFIRRVSTIDNRAHNKSSIFYGSVAVVFLKKRYQI